MSIEPTQADRNAAIRLLELGDQDWQAKEIRIGKGDHFPIVQAFAAYRIASTHPPASEEEGLVERAERLQYERRILAAEVEGVKAEKAMRAAASHKATSFLVGDPESGIPLRSPTPHEIADAIAALPLTLGSEIPPTLAEDALRAALERICDMADKLRQLGEADDYRDGLIEGVSRARTIAIEALANDGANHVD